MLTTLAVVAALKLTVLGAMGVDLWEQMRADGFSPLSSAMAAQRGAKAKPAAAGQAPAAPGVADPTQAAPAADAAAATQAEADMLASNTVPPVRVNESQAARSANSREAELAAREAALKQMERNVDAKLAELKRVEASIKKLLDQADVLKDERIKRQVATYQAMKPRQAAQVLSNMDQDLAVKILTGMKPKVSGEIMTYMQTDKAAKLTEAMTRVQTALPGPAPAR